MTKNELLKKLEGMNISKSVYSLDGGVHDDKYVLSQKPMGKWSVYYSERGMVIGEKKTFGDESAACEYLLNKIQSDPAVHQKS